MSFTLEQVVPWGRSFDEYVAMFSLSKNDLQKRILGCSDGPASFNAVLTRQGGHVVSADPLYSLSREEVARRVDETFALVLEQTRANQHEFIWSRFSSVEQLAGTRREAMNTFLADYEQGHKTGRYVEASLPNLPFANRAFDLALCSHFLFLYSEHFSEDFHVQSVKELCRVAVEVRIFPLLELGSSQARHLKSVVTAFENDGFTVLIEQVHYEFQKGGNQMLKIYNS
jgi:hypothetical protein